MGQDKNIEREYRLLKDKMAVVRRQALLQGLTDKKQSATSNLINPEAINDKCRKRLSIHKFVDYKYQPIVKRQGGSGSSHEKSVSREKMSVSRQKVHRQHNNQQRIHLCFNQQMQHMTKRAQHYKHKSFKLQQALDTVLREKT